MYTRTTMYIFILLLSLQAGDGITTVSTKIKLQSTNTAQSRLPTRDLQSCMSLALAVHSDRVVIPSFIAVFSLLVFFRIFPPVWFYLHLVNSNMTDILQLSLSESIASAHALSVEDCCICFCVHII